MIPFLSLRALGWSAPAIVVETQPVRLSDPAGDAVTRALIAEGQWNGDSELSLIHDGRRLTIRLFLRESRQCDRDADRSRAQEASRIAALALEADGYRIRFRDVLFCERGRKGWEVVIRAEERA